MNKRFNALLLVIVVFSLFVGGCASKFKNIPPSDDFLQQKDVKIGLVWNWESHMIHPEGPGIRAKYYPLGQQGLLDIAVNRMFSEEIETALSKIDLKDLVSKKYFNVFQPAFEDIGFTVRKNVEPYCWKEYRMGSNDFCANPLDKTSYEIVHLGNIAAPIILSVYDYAPVFKELDVDYLLMLDFVRHGVGRTYYGMVPTSPPKGTTLIVSYIIDRNNSKVISQHVASIVEPVQGEWDQPPEYPNLMKAARASFGIAIDEIFIDIFKHAP